MPLACPKKVAIALSGYAGLLEGEPQEALKGFKEVISMEGERGEWWGSLLHYSLSSFFIASCYHAQ